MKKNVYFTLVCVCVFLLSAFIYCVSERVCVCAQDSFASVLSIIRFQYNVFH